MIIAILSVALALFTLLFNLYNFGSFEHSLEQIADRTGSDEALWFSLGECVKSFGFVNYFNSCSLSPKGALISWFISAALDFGKFQSVVFAMAKFIFCWTFIIVSLRRLKGADSNVLTKFLPLSLALNLYWAHLHVQILRDDLIVAVFFALSIEFYLFLKNRSSIAWQTILILLMALLRIEVALVCLLLLVAAWVLKFRAGHLDRAFRIAVIVLGCVLMFKQQLYVPSLDKLHLSFSVLDGFRALFFSPMPHNVFFERGDMRFVPHYAFLSFFVSLGCASFIMLIAVAAPRLIYIRYRLETIAFLILPLAVAFLYSLVDAPVQGPRQALPMSVVIFNLYFLPIFLKCARLFIGSSRRMGNVLVNP